MSPGNLSADIKSTPRIEADLGGAKLIQGPRGEPGPVYTPTVSGGILSWTNDDGLENPPPVNVVGPQGATGATGATGPQGVKGDKGDTGPAGAVYVPAIDASGNLSWSNNGGLVNPDTVNIRGPQGVKGDTGATGPQGAQGPQGEQGTQGAQGPQGPAGSQGPRGYHFTPSVDADGNLSWSNDGNLQNPATVNVRGPQGPQGAAGEDGADGADGAPGAKGDAGAVFIPAVDSAGNLSWTNDGGLDNPDPVNIRGPQGPQGQQGAQGPQGAQGEPGSGLDILGQYDTLEELSAAVPTPNIGDNYYVGASAPYDIYTWTNINGTPGWLNGGALQGAKGDDGEDGGYYTPAVDAEGVLSWAASKSGMAQVPSANIRGPQGVQGPQGQQGAAGQNGADGEDGGYYTPSINSSGDLSWAASKSGMPAVGGTNIRGPQGPQGQQGAQGPAGADGADGENGTTFTPAVSADGVLSWTNDGGKANPSPVNIKGPQGPQGQQGAQGPAGADGENGADGEAGGYYQPTINQETGALSWSASKAGMPSVPGANIKGPPGDDGVTFTPSVDANGNLSWTNDGGEENPETVNIRGPQGPGASTVEATLLASAWSNGQQVVSNAGFVVSGVAYVVCAAPSSVDAYSRAGVKALDVTVAGQMTFSCNTPPAENLAVRVMIVELT